MNKILITSFYNKETIAKPVDRLSKHAELIFGNEVGRSLTEDETIGLLNDFDVVIAADEPYTERTFRSAPKLKMIARDGVGFDSIDLKAATAHGVVATNAPVLHESVADLVMGLIIGAVRKIAACDRGVRQGRWTDRDAFLASDVNGKTLGILGFGRIGKTVARRAFGFNMTILAHDPYVSPEDAEKLGVHLVSRDEVLAASDIVTIHIPFTPDSRSMMDQSAFDLMKDGSYFINAGRGELVDEKALIGALESGKLAGAGLDVIRNEPPMLDNPLLQFDNVIFTPHVGSDTRDTFARIFENVVDNILLFLDGKRPQNVLNPDVFEHDLLAGVKQ